MRKINLQDLIDDAGFPDVVLSEIPRNSGKSKDITAVAGHQFVRFASPSYGESLLNSVVSAKQEDLTEEYRRMFRKLTSVVLPFLKELDEEADESAAFSFVDKLCTNPEALTEEELTIAAKADLSTLITSIRNSSEVKLNISNTRALNNALLVWFLNNRATGGEEVWIMSKIYGMDEKSVTELKQFMHTELNPKTEESVEPGKPQA